MTAVILRATVPRAPRADGLPYETDLCGLGFERVFARRDEDPEAFLKWIDELIRVLEARDRV